MRRTRGVSLQAMVDARSAYLRGWRSYFGVCRTPTVLLSLEQWLRRRLRAALWKQWKRGVPGSLSCANEASGCSWLPRQPAVPMAPGMRRSSAAS